MIGEFAKESLHDDLRWIREALVWKLDGLCEYDIRRPLTFTGTNLLGLVKHSAYGESHRAKIERAARAADPANA
jgi:hypothetical protein